MKAFKIFFGRNSDDVLVGVLKLSTVTFTFSVKRIDDFCAVDILTGPDYMPKEIDEFAQMIMTAVTQVNPAQLGWPSEFAASSNFDTSTLSNILLDNYMYELSKLNLSMSPEDVTSWAKDSKFTISTKLQTFSVTKQNKIDTREFSIEHPTSKALYDENVLKLKEQGVLDNETKQYQFLRGSIASKNGRQFYILFGPSGTGKSTDPRLIAKELGAPIQVIACNKGTDAQKLMSEFIPHVDDKGNLTYRVNLSPAVHILQHGGLLLLDEINMLDPRDLSVLNGLFDGSKKIFLVDGTPLHLHENAIVIGTMNPPIYEGTQKINAATLNRAKVIEYKDIDFAEFQRRLASSTGSDNSHLFTFAFDTVQYIRNFYDGRKMPADFNFRSAKDFVLDMTKNYVTPTDYIDEIFHSSFVAPAGANMTVGYNDFEQVMKVRLNVLRRIYKIDDEHAQVEDLLKGAE